MSVESAKAFCARIMSDDDFRDSLGKVSSKEEIIKIVNAEYSFTKSELVRAVTELAGEDMSAEKLEEMVCEFYQGELAADHPENVEHVRLWFHEMA